MHSLAFSPAGVEPPLLAASSSHGSVHLFRLASHHHQSGGEGGGPGSSMAAAATSVMAGLLSSVVKINIADMVGVDVMGYRGCDGVKGWDFLAFDNTVRQPACLQRPACSDTPT